MSKNIDMLAIVAKGLGEIKNEVVFVGGSVTELYANDTALTNIRTTLDVDCVLPSGAEERVEYIINILSMTIFNYKEYSSLCVCGDIHGEFKTLMFNIKRLGIENSVIIVAGDCGIGFEKEAYYSQLYNKLRKTLDATNNMLLLVRGNHDDPAYFNENRIDFERMKCIPDYSIVNTTNNTTLCIGGAISIDRKQRLEKMSATRRPSAPLYWANEPVVYNKERLSEVSKMKIDTIITHSCPSFCYPTEKIGMEKWLELDMDLSGNLRQERAAMDQIYEHITKDYHPLKRWFYSHFHQSHSEHINNINFTLLDIMEIKEVH